MNIAHAFQQTDTFQMDSIFDYRFRSQATGSDLLKNLRVIK